MENKTVRRVSILQRILRPQKKSVLSESEPTNWKNQLWEINKPPEDLQNAYDRIFTQEALNFLSEIVTEFDEHIDQLHWNRLQSKIRYNSNIVLPKFLETPQRHNKNWKISTLPPRLQCRQIDLGDVSPANTNHLLKSLQTNIQGIQIDFDDGHCPTWRNQIIGLHNVYCIVHNLFHDIPDINDLPILMLRPRAWNMIEHNIMINGKKVPGPLVDFALLIFHNGEKLAANGNGPFFYLSKLEGCREAKLWNDIFVWAQNRLNIPQGTIKACVLIENILSSFEMHEILFELKDHSLGLNCGIWDYAASIINKFGDNPLFILPDRNKYVNMEKHFLKKYMELVVQVCHSRGAPATGGMAAQLLLADNENDIIKKVTNAKMNEIEAGCDGFLLYDIKLVPHIQRLWKSLPNVSPNQISHISSTKITENDLLKMPTGTITNAGLKHNIQVAILFIYNWFEGNGHFIYKGSVEDSATAEISRSQIWQWIRHKAKLEDSTIITKNIIEKYAGDFLTECVVYNQKILSLAKELFIDIVTARYFVDFITTYLNNNCEFRKHQH